MTAALNELVTRLTADRRRQARGALDNPIPRPFKSASLPASPGRAQGTRSGKPIGRAKVGPAREEAIRAALASGKGILKVAREFGTGSSVVQRIKAEAVGAPG
jgi:hypothetical protein